MMNLIKRFLLHETLVPVWMWVPWFLVGMAHFIIEFLWIIGVLG